MPILTDDDGNEFDIPDHLLQAPDDDAKKPNFRRALEDRATTAETRATTAEQRAEAAERQLAFAKAGVPLTDPRSTYFVKGYEGELTTEAIQAEAATFGLTAAPTPAPTTAPGQAALDTIGQAGDGAAVSGERNWAAEYRAAELLPPAEGMAKVRELAREQGVAVLHTQ